MKTTFLALCLLVILASCGPKIIPVPDGAYFRNDMSDTESK